MSTSNQECATVSHHPCIVGGAREKRHQWRRSLCSLLAALLLWPHTSVQAGDVFNGKTVYKNYCEACHGSTGRGEMPGAPNFKRGKGVMKPDAALFESISFGQNAMPGYRGVLSDGDILDVISYLRTLF